MPRSLLLALVLGCLVSTCPSGLAAEPDPAASQLEALVRQLGADSFHVREEAARKLAAHGMAAMPALKAGLEHPDVEVKAKCRRLLAVLLDIELENRIRDFLAGGEKDSGPKFPCWTRFRKLVGEAKEARELFIQMLRAEGNLLDVAEREPKAAGQQLARVARELSTMASIGHVNSLSLGTIAALYFVGSDPQVSVGDDTAINIYYLVYQPAAQQELKGGPHGDRVRAILGAWVSRPASPTTTFQNVMLAAQFDIKEGVTAALELAKNPDVQQKAVGIQAVGKLGSKDQIPVLEKLLTDSTPVSSQKEKGVVLSTQVSDVALAALVHLSGQKFADYGFERIQTNPQFLFFPHSASFTDGAKRDAALKKWRDWQAAQKKS